MHGGWYDEPRFMDVIKRLNQIGENSVRFDRSGGADVAVVIDENSTLYTGLQNTLLRPLIRDQILELGRMGAAYDWVFLNDLDRARPYKLYVFLDAFHVDEQQRAAIDRLRRRGAHALLWLYGAGFAGERALDVQGSSRLTGIDMAVEEKVGPLLVRTDRVVYGTSTGIGPLIYPKDPKAEVLGLLEGHEVPGLVRKAIDGLDVYYSAAPTVAASVLRTMAARAGAHVYNFRDDVLYVNRSFLALHTASAGVRTLHLPRRTSVYDVYAGTLVARDVVQLDVDLPVRRTVIYFLGSEAEWRGLTN
jgi:hypothetical protein